jgi:hypothetical protein
MAEGHGTTELPKISAQRKKVPLMTRRRFLATTIGTLAGHAVLDILGIDEKLGSQGFYTKNKSKSLAQLAENPLRAEKNSIETRLDTVNNILSLPLFSAERDEAETAFADASMDSIENIDSALSITHNDGDRESNRFRLLTKRFDLNQKGHEGKTPLSEELQNWATEWGIGPNNLTMSIEAYPYALAVIKQLMPLLREDMHHDTDPRLLTLTPGGMAAQFAKETRGLIGIGAGQAISQINTEKDAFPTAIEDLGLLTQWLHEDFGLAYKPENIPGSLWPKGHLSGGAIGPQHMTDRARELYSINKSYGLLLNIFDPIDSYVLSHELLAQRIVFDDGSIREGFVQGDGEQTLYGLSKWNADENQYNFVYDADEDFKKRFMNDLPTTPDIRKVAIKHPQHA